MRFIDPLNSVLLSALLSFGAAICLSPNCAEGAIYDIYTTSNGTYTSADQASIASTYGSSSSATAIYANKDIPWGSAGLSSGSSGSGVYTDLFRVQANGTEQGYNSSTGNPYDQKNGVGIPILQVGNASVVTYNSVTYFEFLFDANETDNAISLDEFLVFTSPNIITGTTGQANPTQAEVISYFTNSTNGGTLRYSLDSLSSSGGVTTDNSVLFNANGGSGKGDDGVYFPVSTFQGSNPAGLSEYVYIWIKMGGVGTYNGVDFSSGGGFEEVAYFRGDQGGTTYSSLVPEPSTLFAGYLLGAFVLFRRSRRSFDALY